jgi:hypothetical protein
VLEHLEEHLGNFWKRTRRARTVLLKGGAGSALLLSGTHFSRCVILAHTFRGEDLKQLAECSW